MKLLIKEETVLDLRRFVLTKHGATNTGGQSLEITRAIRFWIKLNEKMENDPETREWVVETMPEIFG